MKLKVKPEDFLVEEVLRLDVRKGAGEFSIYQLTKSGTTTLDAIDDIAKRLHIPKSAIGYGGLKDKASVSSQLISIRGGGLWRIKAKNYELLFVGRSEKPVTKRALLGNRFQITVRDISPTERTRIETNLPKVLQQGFVNYYDKQRFSSARHGKGFIAQKVVQKRFDEAVRLLFESSWRQSSKSRRFKNCVTQNWGNWEMCIDLAPTPWERRILEHLSQNPNGWRKALQLVPREILFLWATVYQAHLWNKAAAKLIKSMLPQELFVEQEFVAGQTLVLPKKLPDELAQKLLEVKLPLPSPKLELDGTTAEIYDAVLKEESIPCMPALRSKITGMVFKTHRRKLMVKPQELSWRWEEDDLFPGRQKLVMRFFLPKGSYATMLLRQLVYP